MSSTDPKNISRLLHLMAAGLVSGLLSKEEIIEWADQIIEKEENPDIFFIDLALSSSKSVGDVLQYINDRSGDNRQAANGRPLLALIYKKYKSGSFSIEKTVRTMYRLKYEAVFTSQEESFIDMIDDLYDLAKNKIHGTIEDVEKELDSFLRCYQDYSIDNFENWHTLDNEIEIKLEKDIEQPKQISEQEKKPLALKKKNPWWRFWR